MEMLLIVSILVVIDSTAEEDVQSFERSVLSGPQNSEGNADTGSESDSAGKHSDAEVPMKRKVRAIQDLGIKFILFAGHGANEYHGFSR
jgi:hypothetical protein